jgi:hypothetical protein
MSKIQRKPLPSETHLSEDFKKEDLESYLERASTELQTPPPAHAESVKLSESDVSAHPPEPLAATSIRRPTRFSFGEKFERRFPAHKRYFGMKRKIFLCVLVGIVVLLLALIIGLAVGLTKGRSK